ncbi:MAG: response regulator [bacterium]
MEKELNELETRRDSDEKEKHSHQSINNEKSNLVIIPLRIIAFLTLVAGIFALVYEVQYFQDFSVQIYFGRLIATVIGFAVLFLSYTNPGRMKTIFLVHLLLLSIIGSFVSIIYFIPSTLFFNSHILALVIFTIALFLSWETQQQIIVAIYYNILFSGAILFNDNSIYFLPNMYATVLFVLFVSAVSVIASSVNYKLRKAALKKSYEAREIFENSNEGIFRAKMNGEFILANPSFIEMIGYKDNPDILRTLKLENVFWNMDDFIEFKKRIKERSKIKNYRTGFRRNGDVKLMVNLNARAMLNQNNDIDFIEGSMQDITEIYNAELLKSEAMQELNIARQRAEQSAKESMEISEFKTAFFAKLNHDLRTPISSILGFLSLIEEDLFKNKAELKEFTQKIKIATEQLLELMENNLIVSKIKAGKLELESHVFNLREEIQKVKLLLENDLLNRNLNLTIRIDNNLPTSLIGDFVWYKQILINLLTNAIKFTEKGSITLSIKLIELKGDKLRFETVVEDTGVGIPDDKLDSIFEPYVQLKVSGYRGKGAGLGLQICRELVHLMSGSIKVTSNMGSGSTFTFDVEMKTDREAKTIAETWDKNIADSYTEHPIKKDIVNDILDDVKRKIILLVEDDPVNQKIEFMTLNKFGYEVETVANGFEAVEQIKSRKYDMIVMDMRMPKLDGLSATKMIRNLDDLKNKIPIIAVTAYASSEDRKKCLDAGMNDYISKPIDLRYFKLTIDKWMKGDYH